MRFLHTGASLFVLPLIIVLSSGLSTANAVMPTNPVTDAEFSRLPSGVWLKDISVSGSKLTLARGSGQTFTSSHQRDYEALRDATKATVAHPVQWVLMDLDGQRIVDQSLSSQLKIFGASTSKIFVGASLLNKQSGNLSSSQLQLMSNMLVVSSNTAWTELQRQTGDGDSNRGRQTIHDFTQGMNYERTRGFQGYLGQLHGNELTAFETAKFLSDTYMGRYVGAETLWKLMHACRTGGSRARLYLPSEIYVGGKTGTYDGPTVDPETGSSENPDGSSYKVRVRNHAIVLNVAGRQYALVILANSGSDSSAALLAGGLYREYMARP